MFNKTIRSRVINKINAHVDAAEKAYRAECIDIDKQAEVAKIAASDRQVETILGKILQ